MYKTFSNTDTYYILEEIIKNTSEYGLTIYQKLSPAQSSITNKTGKPKKKRQLTPNDSPVEYRIYEFEWRSCSRKLIYTY